MNNFFSVFNPKRDSRALPWQRTPSIYAHIQAHLNPITGRLKPEGIKLPDDERLRRLLAGEPLEGDQDHA